MMRMAVLPPELKGNGFLRPLEPPSVYMHPPGLNENPVHVSSEARNTLTRP
jgi:hypothetical protein